VRDLEESADRCKGSPNFAAEGCFSFIILGAEEEEGVPKDPTEEAVGSPVT